MNIYKYSYGNSHNLGLYSLAQLIDQSMSAAGYFVVFEMGPQGS